MGAPKRRSLVDQLEESPSPLDPTLSKSQPDWVDDVLNYILLLHRHAGPEEWTLITKGGNYHGVSVQPHRLKNDPNYRREIASKLRKFGPEAIFVVVNGLIQKWAKDKLVWRLNALWVDLDCYKFGIRAEDAWSHLQETYVFAEAGIPEPSLVLKSGRGLYLMWLLRGELTAAKPANVRTFQECQKALRERLKHLGADLFAINPSRRLRPIGSIHPMGNVVVRKIDGCEEEYSLDEVAFGMGISIQKFQNFNKGRGNTGKRPPASRLPINFAPKRRGVTSLNHNRLADLETLCRMRGGIVEGLRHYFLLYFLTILSISGPNFDDLLNQATEVNLLFHPPLSEREVGKQCEWVTKQTEPHPPKNQTIISTLGISKKEQRHLRTIISMEEKDRRAQERYTTGEMAIKVLDLYNAHPEITQREIARRVEIGRTTVQKIMKANELRPKPAGRPKPS